uniref:WhiB family transcriptional regulator n=1 Tax=Saccharothrix mutabilis TaxID=33921 RepID=UPI0031E32505
MTPGEKYEAIAADLDRLAHVPNEVLQDIVLDGAECLWAYAEDSEGPGVPASGRPLSEIGCPVWRACLELELRTPGPYSGGVCSGLSDEDFVALHQVWFARRVRMGGERGPLT